MAPMDLRVRVLGWALARRKPIGSMSEAEIVALQQRHTPSSPLADRMFGAVVPGVTFADQAIQGPESELTIRVYRAQRGDAQRRPLIVNFHGGGFVFGDLRLGDWLCSSVAANVGAVVVSVAYRLAPAHRFPAAVEDAYATLVWAAEHAEELGAEGPLGVMGESAGGNLAAVTCLLARDRGGPAISHQTLLYPVTDLAAQPAATRRTPILTASDMVAYNRLYLGDADPHDPRVSPLRADDHGKLPPALIQVAEHDPLRDTGARYAEVLQAAGVPVRFTEYIGMPHGFLNFPGVCRGAAQAMAELCAEQAKAVGG